MDLQARKLNLIEYLIHINDEKIINILEDIIKMSKSEKHRVLEPFTHQELLDRAKKSNKDYFEGNFKIQEKVESESKEW